jgi:hypothetical protein
MKKTIVMVAICVTLSLVSKAQCNQNIKWTSSKTEFLDAANKLEHANDETVIVTASQTKITIVPHGSTEETMTGDITGYACNWTDKQNGKTSFKSVLVDASGDRKHATINIEAVNGKTTILLEVEERPSKIKLYIYSFEEVK